MQRSSAVDIQPVRLLDTNFMWRVFFVFAGLALLSIAISITGRIAGRSIAMAGHTDDTALVEVVIGNNVLVAPKNEIRFAEGRRNGIAQKLDLYMRWPDLSGYSDAARADFNHANGKPNILFVSFSQRMTSRDMSGRFEPIYSALTTATGEQAPAGLTLRRFNAKAGYENETLYVAERAGAAPYVARCLASDAGISLAPCERDVQVGDGLSMSYRFPRELLAEWSALDAAMVKKARAMLRTGG
jgi:hypothetical protein